MVIKKDDSREVYERSKLEKGILHSCHKRPVSSQQIDSMVDEIETQIFNMEEKEVSSATIGDVYDGHYRIRHDRMTYDKEVSSSAIGELVMKKLQEVDEVAYVRFASVYREFKDVNTFMEEIGKLLKK